MLSTSVQEGQGESTLTFKHFSKYPRLGWEQAEHTLALWEGGGGGGGER